MHPAHVKLLLLVLLLMSGIGGYYYITTAPSPDRSTNKTDQQVVKPTPPAAINVTNVRIEQSGDGLRVSGPAQVEIDSGATFLRVTKRVVGTSEAVVSVTEAVADLRIENGKLRGGLLTAQLAGSLASFQITRVTTLGNGGTLIGTLTLVGQPQELTLPFTRDGNTIAGDIAVADLRVVWRLGIK